jgi:hypothetical protein
MERVVTMMESQDVPRRWDGTKEMVFLVDRFRLLRLCVSPLFEVGISWRQGIL